MVPGPIFLSNTIGAIWCKMGEMPFELVSVPLAERAYDIRIGTGNLAEVAPFVDEIASPAHVAVITDTIVEAHYLEPVVSAFETRNVRVSSCSVAAGEASKSVSQLNQVWNWLLEVGTDRASVVLALGGGVVGDLAGFVAASFARGLRFFQIPTSLLAQVDSSVGGKVGINLPTAKNMVGAFWQPVGVLVDTDVLQTLEPREYRAGLAEVVKYGAILDPDFFGFLERHVDEIRACDPYILRAIIRRSCELKAQVVTEDERETSGRRAILNYGHTFAHGFEAVAGYGTILHGEAVSMGMVCASRLAECLGRVTTEDTDRLIRLLQQFELPVAIPPLPLEKVLAVMATDKKVQRGVMRYVLPNSIGSVELVSDVDISLAKQAMLNSSQQS